jgi:predicted RNase H-like HicB family nuclease
MDRSCSILPEYIVSLKIEKLDEGVYLATSDTLQGLVAQGRTIAEAMEIAQDVARKLIESYIEHGDSLPAGMTPAAKIISNIKIPVAVTG